MSHGYSDNPYIDAAIAAYHDRWLEQGAPEYYDEEDDESEEDEEED